jgi:anthranilate phosphoribosyltransferase (EC 2.4.2.18)
MNIPEVLEKILSKQNLSVEEAKELATAIMKGELNEAQTAGILVALRAKGETPEEIAGFALAMREAALKVGPGRTPSTPLEQVAIGWAPSTPARQPRCLRAR